MKKTVYQCREAKLLPEPERHPPAILISHRGLSRGSEIINLPISHCTNQHGTPRSGEGDDRRRYPIAYRKHGINNCQADVAVACKVRIIGVNAVEDGFLSLTVFSPS